MKFARAAGDTCIISRNFTFMPPSRAQTLRALYALGDLSGIDLPGISHNVTVLGKLWEGPNACMCIMGDLNKGQGPGRHS